MPTQTEIAERWGVTRQYVYKLVKAGCPTTSYEKAEAWRKANASNREPQAAAKKASKKKPAKQVNKERPATRVKGGGLKLPAKPEKPKDTGDPLKDAVESARYTLERISILVDAAARDSNMSIPLGPLLSQQSRAQTNLFKAEKMYREEMEKRGKLIDKDDAYELFKRGFQFILKGLKELPKTCSVEANPEKPEIALAAVERHALSLQERARERFLNV